MKAKVGDRVLFVSPWDAEIEEGVVEEIVPYDLDELYNILDDRGETHHCVEADEIIKVLS